jgi:hypothetical protein
LCPRLPVTGQAELSGKCGTMLAILRSVHSNRRCLICIPPARRAVTIVEDSGSADGDPKVREPFRLDRSRGAMPTLVDMSPLSPTAQEGQR